MYVSVHGGTQVCEWGKSHVRCSMQAEVDPHLPPYVRKGIWLFASLNSKLAGL